MGFGGGAYRRRSEATSLLLDQLFERLRGEAMAMYTMKDFEIDYMKKHLPRLTRQQQKEILQSLPMAVRLAGLSEEERLAGLSEEVRLAGLSAEATGRPAAGANPPVSGADHRRPRSPLA